MFALNPGGSGAGGGKSGDSQLRQNLWFWGQLGVYFCLVRGAFVFFSGREEPKALNN
jgi:hypothetical protein